MKALTILAILVAGTALADEPVPLKAGHGDDLASAYCNTCHTSDYIVMNSPFLIPDGWKAEVTKMRKAFGAPIDDETAADIVAYLGQNYVPPGKN